MALQTDPYPSLPLRNPPRSLRCAKGSGITVLDRRFTHEIVDGRAIYRINGTEVSAERYHARLDGLRALRDTLVEIYSDVSQRHD